MKKVHQTKCRDVGESVRKRIELGIKVRDQNGERN